MSDVRAQPPFDVRGFALISPGLAALVYALVLLRAALAQRASPSSEAIVLGAVTILASALLTVWSSTRRSGCFPAEPYPPGGPGHHTPQLIIQ